MGSRWDDAMSRAADLVNDASDDNLISVVEAGPVPRVIVAFSRDPVGIQAAIDHLEPTGGIERLDEAVRLARGLATPDRPSTLLILSDGGTQPLRSEPLVGATHLRFDDLADNLGISALSMDSSTEGNLRAFLEIANWSSDAKEAQVEIAKNGVVSVVIPFQLEPLATGRATVPLDAGPGDRVTAIILDNVDGNPLDDEATVIVPTPTETSVALLGEGSVFLDALMKSLPSFVPATGNNADIQIMDGITDGLFARPVWLIAPQTPPDGIEITGTIQNAVVTFQQPGEPLLDGLDMSELVVGEAQIVDAFGWFPIVQAGEVPLVLLGEVNGHRAVYFTFDLTESNFPILVSFPIFASRALEFLGASTAPSVTAETSGEPIALVAPANHFARVQVPSGETIDLPMGATLFRNTGSPGIYTVSYIDPNGTASAGPLAVRAFDPSESGGPFRDIPVVNGSVGDGDRTELIREWAAWFLGTIMILLALEWWVGHRTPWRRRTEVTV